jgi:hypothetical protein
MKLEFEYPIEYLKMGFGIKCREFSKSFVGQGHDWQKYFA